MTWVAFVVRRPKPVKGLTPETLLFFPPKKNLGPMCRIGREYDYPHRPPTHWAYLPEDPL